MLTRLIEILISLAIVAVLFVIVGLVLPSHRHLSKDVETNRKLTVVYDTLNSLKRFKDWNVVPLRDPRMAMKLSGPDAGKGARLDYAQYAGLAGALARRLGQRVGPGERVALLMQNSLDLAVATFAVHALRAQAVPLNPGYRERELAFMLEDAAPCMVLHDDSVKADLRALCPWLDADAIVRTGDGAGLLALLPDHPADWRIALPMALCGAGFGLFQSPNNHTIVTSAPLHRAGAASGMLGTARLTGQSLGAVLLGLIFSVQGVHDGGPAIALGLAAALAAASAVFSTLRVRAPSAFTRGG